MKKIIILNMLIISMMIIGCAHEQATYTKPAGYGSGSSSSNEQFQKDKYECAYNAKIFCYRSQGWLWVDICEKDHTDTCLRSKGWR